MSQFFSLLNTLKCTLCNSSSSQIYHDRNGAYYKCATCCSVFLHPDFYPSPELEKKRYESHNNNPEDKGYQNFVSPLVNEILAKVPPGSYGLDFGAGPGPVATKMLREKGYQMELYDPFFWNETDLLQNKYDFVFCCEVIEHFHNPDKEFKLLRSLLKPAGSLFCMTDFVVENNHFPEWYYKNDSTHVFFYHPKALEWIKINIGFSGLVHKGRVFELVA